MLYLLIKQSITHKKDENTLNSDYSVKLKLLQSSSLKQL